MTFTFTGGCERPGVWRDLIEACYVGAEHGLPVIVL